MEKNNPLISCFWRPSLWQGVFPASPFHPNQKPLQKDFAWLDLYKMISLVDPIDTNPEIVLYIIYPDLLASRFHCIYISDHIYIYVYICICHWFLAFLKKARVHPEGARPKLDLVVHQVLQAFSPQMPGAYQKPPPEKCGQMAILGSPLDGPWKWSRWWFLSKEIEWKKITLWFLVFGGLLCGRVCFQHLHSIPTRNPYKKTLHDWISTKWSVW